MGSSKKRRAKKRKEAAVAAKVSQQEEESSVCKNNVTEHDDKRAGKKTINEPVFIDSSNDIEDDSNSNSNSNSLKKEQSTAPSAVVEKKDKSKISSSKNSFHCIKPSLSEGILKYVEHKRFQQMTPVQAATIPLFLTNKDVAVQAVTGSGKTLSFLIPIIEMILRRTILLKRKQVGSIVISPTRELAKQTHMVCTELCKFCSINNPLLLVGGGSSVTDDLRLFTKQSSDIIIGTPGRIEDVLTRYDVMDVSELECLVLDEADVLLDMGFDVTITSILSKLPRMRRTGLFSATGTASNNNAGSRGIKELMSRAGMRNPVWVNVAIASSDAAAKQKKEDRDVVKAQQQHWQKQQATPSSLTNYYIVTPLDEKLSRLTYFLRTHRNEKIIVFFLTCACVEFFGNALQQIMGNSQYIELLHGKMVQKRREKAMERFRGDEQEDQGEGESSTDNGSKGGTKKADCSSHKNGGALFCTDVAARGLDITNVDWVVQFDAPVDPASYVHRVGRSARAGKNGSSLLFLSPKEESYIDLLEGRNVPLQPLSEQPQKEKEGNNNCKDEAKHGVNGTDGDEKEKPGKLYPDVLPKIRQKILSDRDLLEKGTKAFTSYIRAYKEHQCAFIFRFASLDLGVLATAFCLLRLPKMPELRDKKLVNFKPAGPEIDIHSIAFKDKVREKARQKRLAAELAAGGKNAKQIKAEQRQAEWARKQKERRQAEIKKGRNPNKKRGRQAKIFDEWDDLAKEERLYKKLRRKKITQEQYDELMYGSNEASNDKEASGNDDTSDSD